MATAEDLFALFAPALAGTRLELVDVEFRSGTLLVTVDQDGGVDLDALTEANRALSAVLDERDPIPGRYTLEVSSPGVERTLRTPAHFRKAVGERVTVKTRPQVPGDRRLTGTVVDADDDGFVLRLDTPSGTGTDGAGRRTGPPAAAESPVATGATEAPATESGTAAAAEAAERAETVASEPPGDAQDGSEPGHLRLAYRDIDRARTLFEWGPAPRPQGRPKGASGTKPAGRGPGTTQKTQKRKQVTTP